MKKRSELDAERDRRRYYKHVKAALGEALVASVLAQRRGYRQDCLNAALTALEGALANIHFEDTERAKHPR